MTLPSDGKHGADNREHLANHVFLLPRLVTAPTHRRACPTPGRQRGQCPRLSPPHSHRWPPEPHRRPEPVLLEHVPPSVQAHRSWTCVTPSLPLQTHLQLTQIPSLCPPRPRTHSCLCLLLHSTEAAGSFLILPESPAPLSFCYTSQHSPQSWRVPPDCHALLQKQEAPGGSPAGWSSRPGKFPRRSLLRDFAGLRRELTVRSRGRELG